MSIKTPKSGAGRPKSLTKRAAILSAAQTLFLRHGYEGSSMDAIALEAEVSKLTVYNHFTDKETLFCAAIAAQCEMQLSELFITPSDTAPSNLRECLLAIGHSFQTLVDSPESIALHRLIISHALSNPALSHLFYEATALRIINKMEQLLISIDQAQQLEIAHPRQAAEHFFALLKGSRNLQLLVGYQPDRLTSNTEQHVESVVDLFIRAYQPLDSSQPTSTQ